MADGRKRGSRMRKAFLAFFAGIALVIGGFAAASPAQAANTPMLGSWAHQSKPTGIMNYIYVVDDTSSVWPVSAAMNVWNSYLSVNSINVRFAVPYYGTCSDAHGTLPRCFYVQEDGETAYWNNIGTTWYSIGGGAIHDPENDNPATNGKCNFKVNHIALHEHNVILSSGWATARETVIMHELGHALGLGHAGSPPTDLMYPEIDNSTMFQNVLRTPSAANMLALKAEYDAAC